jgi:4-hydroxythreonine-4-phosphate dehydrogenase
MSQRQQAPRLAITMGDAAGIGPEVIVRAWLQPEVHRCCRPLVVGHAEVLRRAVKALGVALDVHECTLPEASTLPVGPLAGWLPPLACLSCCADSVVDVPAGHIDARAGRAAYEALCRAAQLALDGQVEGIVTAPLSKAALHLAGLSYPGHTEILAELCNSRRFAMMLYLPPHLGVGGPAGLAVVHATLHVALRDAIGQLTTERILQCCRLADEGLAALGASLPRIGVCALNPHAGEGGLFGDEEARLIAPAVESATRLGLRARGPLPADALLVRARQGEFDAVVAMYHDQGHIALKLLGMHQAVNITLGLPIVRTSPAHGTAMDIAGTQRAECSGMVAAIQTAARLAIRRQPGSSHRDASSAVISAQAASRGGEYSNQRSWTPAPRLTSEK